LTRLHRNRSRRTLVFVPTVSLQGTTIKDQPIRSPQNAYRTHFFPIAMNTSGVSCPLCPLNESPLSTGQSPPFAVCKIRVTILIYPLENSPFLFKRIDFLSNHMGHLSPQRVDAPERGRILSLSTPPFPNWPPQDLSPFSRAFPTRSSLVSRQCFLHLFCLLNGPAPCHQKN